MSIPPMRRSCALGLESVLLRASNDPGRSVEGPTVPLNRAGAREFAKIAKRYLDSDAYKRLLESGKLRSDGARLSHDPVEVIERGGFDLETGELRSDLIDNLRQRTTVNVGDAGAVVPIDQQVWPPVEIPVRQIRLLDLISMVTTESDMVNFVQQTVRNDFAAETPYGTVAPEADYEFALKQASVKRIPTFIPATKDVLADQGQLQGLLQDQLMMGVRLKLESQFLVRRRIELHRHHVPGHLECLGHRVGDLPVGHRAHLGVPARRVPPGHHHHPTFALRRPDRHRRPPDGL